MHSEKFVVPHPAGIHHATLQAFCNHFRPGTVKINGWDPTSFDSADELALINQGEPVEIAAETGDPQTDRDAVHIAQALISKGRDPWQLPGQRMSLPLERYNQAANYVRENWLGLPTEHHGTLSKWRVSAVDDRFHIGDIVECTSDYGRVRGEIIEEPPADKPQGYYRVRLYPDERMQGYGALPETALFTWGFMKLIERTRPEVPSEELADELWPDTMPDDWTISKWRYAEVAAPVMPDINYVLDYEPDQTPEEGWKASVWGPIHDYAWKTFPEHRPNLEENGFSPSPIDWEEARQWLLGHCNRQLAPDALQAIQNATPDLEFVYRKEPNNAYETMSMQTVVPLNEIWTEWRIDYAGSGGTISRWRYVERPSTAAVSSDMSVTSKWKIVALGELQQPGGVGATQDYNPVVDGPNPDGPEVDNASNSPEQEVAMQTWINTAVDMLNRGEDATTIIARLAHDGCPNPQEVLQRAQQQPMEEQSPVSDSIGQDAFKNPPPADQTGEMQGLSNQPPVLARVRIAGTSMTGTEVDRWEGLWGDGAVKVALDTGGTLEVAPSQVETIEDSSVASPVSEIQKFIDSMPPVEPSRPHIEARLANLEVVRRAVRANVSKVSLYDQQKLAEMDTAATEETALLKEALSNLVEEHEVGYFSHLPRYQYNAFDVATPEIKAWSGRPREAGAIWASENFTHAVDKDEFTAVAAHYASTLGLTGSQFEQFLAGAFEDGLKSLPPVTSEDDPNAENIVIDNEGPADALFV